MSSASPQQNTNRRIKNSAALSGFLTERQQTSPPIRPSTFFLSLCLCLGLCCTMEAGGRGGQQGALLGRLAQLYLLLDDPSRVVDERVDQTGHCRQKTEEDPRHTSH